MPREAWLTICWSRFWKPAEDDALLADLRADFVHRLVEVAAHGPVLPAAADAVDEVGDHFAPARGVHDLRMELDAEKPPMRMLDGRVVGVVGGADDDEVLRDACEFVAVRVPDLERRGQALEERARAVGDGERALAVFALLAFLDLPAEELREELHAVTDAEHGHAELEDAAVGQRRVSGIHAGRAAAEDQAARFHRGDPRGGGVVADDGGIHVALTDAARDDLRVLGPEIQDDDLLVH